MGLRMLDTACHQYLALRVIALRVIALRVIWGKTVLEMIGGRYRCGRSFAVPTTTTLKRNGMSCAHVSEVESHTCFILLPEELGEVEPRMFFFGVSFPLVLRRVSISSPFSSVQGRGGTTVTGALFCLCFMAGKTLFDELFSSLFLDTGTRPPCFVCVSWLGKLFLTSYFLPCF